MEKGLGQSLSRSTATPDRMEARPPSRAHAPSQGEGESTAEAREVVIAAILDYCLTWAFAGQVVAAGFALGGQWMVGNKSTLGPALGICGQIAWTVMIVLNATYGLLLSNVPMYFVQVRNLRKWRREHVMERAIDRLVAGSPHLSIDPKRLDTDHPLLRAARRMGC